MRRAAPVSTVVTVGSWLALLFATPWGRRLHESNLPALHSVCPANCGVFHRCWSSSVPVPPGVPLHVHMFMHGLPMLMTPTHPDQERRRLSHVGGIRACVWSNTGLNSPPTHKSADPSDHALCRRRPWTRAASSSCVQDEDLFLKKVKRVKQGHRMIDQCSCAATVEGVLPEQECNCLI